MKITKKDLVKLIKEELQPNVHLVLNDKVRQELIKNNILGILWFAKYGSYDDEIEPLHRPEWIENQKKLEETRLKELKEIFHKSIMLFNQLKKS